MRYKEDDGIFFQEPTQADLITLIKKNRKFSKKEIKISVYTTHREYDLTKRLYVYTIGELLFIDLSTDKKYYLIKDFMGNVFIKQAKTRKKRN